MIPTLVELSVWEGCRPANRQSQFWVIRDRMAQQWGVLRPPKRGSSPSLEGFKEAFLEKLVCEPRCEDSGR